MAIHARWGVAKRMLTRMVADGVGPHDDAAVAEWIASFNAQPARERGGMPGSVGGRMVPATGAVPGATTRRRTRRKAAKQARKRNRR